MYVSFIFIETQEIKIVDKSHSPISESINAIIGFVCLL